MGSLPFLSQPSPFSPLNKHLTCKSKSLPLSLPSLSLFFFHNSLPSLFTSVSPLVYPSKPCNRRRHVQKRSECASTYSANNPCTPRQDRAHEADRCSMHNQGATVHPSAPLPPNSKPKCVRFQGPCGRSRVAQMPKWSDRYAADSGSCLSPRTGSLATRVSWVAARPSPRYSMRSYRALYCGQLGPLKRLVALSHVKRFARCRPVVWCASCRSAGVRAALCQGWRRHLTQLLA